jgi:glycosyltransferase involved in cell wall biosynthesis
MPRVSIIIPAFNEQQYIAATLEAITDNPPPCSYEVIVVDNGSTDSTFELVKAANVRLLSCPEGTVAAVRNKGVAASTGDVLVFIDADVEVSNDWQLEMTEVLRQFVDTPLLVTGSRCLPPDKTFWLNRFWFCFLTQYDAPYINSGHLITSRLLFDQVVGFSGALETAEDYDFCMKAKAVGAELVNNKKLSVIHHGYPRTIGAFIRRERWHGSEDVQSLASFKASKMAWLATLQLSLLVLCIVALLIGEFMVLPFYILFSFVFCLALTVFKFRPIEWRAWLLTPCIFYLYLCGRGLALVDRIRS